jgi:hypothetical protein
MATTTNFGWETPDDTDLVKDGALAMRTLGNAIDTSLVDLKGGTTGQVLSKTSNTDMDFTWVTSDDANAIQNAIVDAKGDLITATAADTPARLAVGSNGQILTADSTTATGLKWATAARPSFVGCGLYKSGTQAITTSTWTSITWDTEEYDTDAFHSTSTNTSRFTVPTGLAGKYSISGTIYFAANSGNNLVRMAKNGSLFNYINNTKRDNTQGNAFTVSGVYDLAVNDYLELQVFQDTGGNLNVEGTSTTTRWQISYLGA